MAPGSICDDDRVDDALHQALAPVRLDLGAADGAVRLPTIEEQDWTGDPGRPSAMIWSADGTGRGVSVDRSASLAERVVSAADQLQEWMIEELWGSSPTNWPPCPWHPDSHPLRATVRADDAWWSCPRDGTPVARIGTLPDRA